MVLMDIFLQAVEAELESNLDGHTCEWVDTDQGDALEIYVPSTRPDVPPYIIQIHREEEFLVVRVHEWNEELGLAGWTGIGARF